MSKATLFGVFTAIGALSLSALLASLKISEVLVISWGAAAFPVWGLVAFFALSAWVAAIVMAAVREGR